jgi:hypothetical protein
MAPFLSYGIIDPISVFKPVNTKKGATKLPHLLLFSISFRFRNIGHNRTIIKRPKGQLLL